MARRSRSEKVSWVWLVTAISSIISMWAFSFFLVSYSNLNELGSKMGDLPTILFGAASVALFIFSILVAVLAIFGWQSIQAEVRSKAEEAARRITDPLSSELAGRTMSIQGYLLGEWSMNDEGLEFDPNREAVLIEAIKLCQQGYDHFLKSGTGGAGEIMALNNLVYYTCVYKDEARREFLVKKARQLKEIGQEHNSVNVLLTSCRVMMVFGSALEKEEALVIVSSILGREEISKRERREAENYQQKLRRLTSLDALN